MPAYFRAPANLLILGFVAAMPAAAMAQDEDKGSDAGFFVAVKAGVTSPTDATFDGVQAPEAPSPGSAGAPAIVDVEFDDDFTFAGAIGYRFGTRFLGIFQPSIELEYSNASADVSGGALNGGNQTFAGDADINTFTLNYRSEIRWSDTQTVVPFTGGGIGIADVDLNAVYFPNNGIATAPTFAATGSDSGLVLHSNVGLGFKLTDTIELETSIRYQRVSGLDFERRFIAGGNDAFNADLEGRYETVSGFAGVRYRF
ncbi:hypothetical protein FGU71_01225 [Erythrobacter insulae]|uniref:Outer membrane protein beta-barrel domain-containing protein n=1 Tax=Erythrobacter insulae TaxID=2584124 RepID=A0A547P8Z7_9SPHN|nr:hypothetical protein [Erythrobacter insulae]TRD10620.1 hypothetical protein FGU71_01225 [Erythrobacter insulae]